MKLSGVVVAALTPLTSDGISLADERVFAAYYDFLFQYPLAGLFVCGTTGEGWHSPYRNVWRSLGKPCD